MDTLTCAVALAQLPGIGPRRYRALIDRFGSALQVRQAGPKAAEAIPGCGVAVRRALEGEWDEAAARESVQASRAGAYEILPLESPHYPPHLRAIPDPPCLLYVRGRLDPADAQAVAIVGARRCTMAGKELAGLMAADLAAHGVTVVSGLARGIDGAAHRGALRARGRTLAVLGCGIDVLYPFEHQELMADICESGALLTEFSPGMPPMPGNFAVRNRILSGLAQATVVVEAGERSGALITAQCARAQGRKVFAVPGPPGAEGSRGTNRLIRDGAVLAESAGDIFRELFPEASAGITAGSGLSPREESHLDLTPEEAQVYRALPYTPIHIDRVIRETQLSASRVGAIILTLELAGLVASFPGKRFARSR